MLVTRSIIFCSWTSKEGYDQSTMFRLQKTHPALTIFQNVKNGYDFFEGLEISLHLWSKIMNYYSVLQ